MSLEMDKIAKNIESKYRPEGNTHTPMWEGKYIGGSSIVAKRAGEIARHILGREEDTINKKWGFLGNTIGDAAFEDIEHKEIRFEHDLPGGWLLAGHCDGITATSEGIVVLEHKYFLKNESEKQEKATRQAMLYLAMGAHKVGTEGTQTFPVAAYVDDGEPFTWRKDQKPLGVITAIAPSHLGEGCVVTRELDWDACREVLDFYTRKAEFIIKACEKGDPSYADMWDNSPEGLQEFSADDITNIQTEFDDEELAAVIAEYATLSKERSAADYRIKKHLKPKIDAAIKSSEGNKIGAGNWYAKSTFVPPKEISYVRPGYTRLTVHAAENPENWVKTDGKYPTPKKLKDADKKAEREKELGY